jgi:hypothetical protein
MKIRLVLAAVAIALAVPATGAAGDDEDGNESVTRVSCLGGTAELRLEAERDEGDEDDEGDEGDSDGGIAVELRVSVRRPVVFWRLVLLHERRIVYRGTLYKRTRRSIAAGYSLRYARRVPEWLGRQTVAARLATDSGRTCRLEATI